MMGSKFTSRGKLLCELAVKRKSNPGPCLRPRANHVYMDSSDCEDASDKIDEDPPWTPTSDDIDITVFDCDFPVSSPITPEQADVADRAAKMLINVNDEASCPQTLSCSQDDAVVGHVFQRPQADPDFLIPPTFKQQSRWPVADDTVIDHEVNDEASCPQTLSRSQDDAVVGHVFQRPQADPDFPIPPTFKQQSRWPVTDETVIDHVMEVGRADPDASEDPNENSTQKTKAGLHVGLSVKNPKRVWNKRDCCIFCEKTVTNFTRHLSRAHAEEIEVAKILAIPKGSKTRKLLFEKLRRKGDFFHNTNCLKEESGEIIVTQRPTKETDVSKYLPCQFCLGFYSKNRLYRHVKVCKHKGELPYNNNAQSMGAALLFVTPECNEELKSKIFSTMRIDSISKVCKEDRLICEFGLRLLKHHQEDHMRNVISQKMRELGRLKLELQSTITTKAKAYLEEFFDPDLYPDVIKCVQSVAGFDSDSGKFKIPSLAYKLGYSLKHCCEILECRGIMQGNNALRNKCKRFMQLLSKMWRYDVSINASKTLKEAKFNKPRLLPLAEDLKKLHDYIVSKENSLFHELSMSPSELVWRGLAEVCLTHIILLNRRRSGEAQRILLSDYLTINRNKTVDNASDSNQLLSEIEKKLFKSCSRFEIRGKKGRGVPVILTSQMKANLELLVKTREECNIMSENPYLFPIPRTPSSCIRGNDVMRNHAKACGAKLPENLRSTALRKQVATMSQLLNLSGNDVEGLATFMGHSVDVHKEYYRLPDNILQVAKISKLLLALESGKIQEIKGKNFDNINVDEPLSENECNEDNEDFEDNQEVDESLNNNTNATTNFEDVLNYPDEIMPNTKETYVGPKRRKTSTKNPWSSQEREAVYNHFKKYILLKKVPNKDESMKCLTENPCLSKRSWKHIKFQVKNMFGKS